MRGLLNDDIARFERTNYFSFPEILPYTGHVDCSCWVDFDNGVTDFNAEHGLHFYISDYKFERIWNNPFKYLDVLLRHNFVVQPDFSLYYDFPVALQIYNKYRNHWLAAYFSTVGVSMIPNISLSTSDCYDWSFLGYPSNSVVAFSDIGAIRDKLSKELTYSAYDEMIKRLVPSQVLYFTRSRKYAPSEATVVEIPFLKGGV